MKIFSAIEQQFDAIWDKKFQFIGVFMLIVTLTYGVLFAIDFIPETPDTVEVTGTATTTDAVAQEPIVEEVPVVVPKSEDATPNKIIFDSLSKEVAVLNPNSSTVAALDEALLSGVVRHPESADLLTDGTMLLFGHSSYLPVVHNKSFQAFNGIQDLKWGDKIRLQSNDFEYVYRVERVYKAKASSDEIAIAGKEKRLTLATCNSFGTKDDRFIVESILIDSYPLK